MDETAAPLFRQIATLIEDSIVENVLRPGDRAPSTNELAAFHSINPATARRGLALLVEAGVLRKLRGRGMFVTDEARETILRRRREEFTARFLVPLVDEAVRLDMSRDQVHEIFEKVAESRGLYV